MSVRRPDDLMEAIERVLRADTANLRELAEIAGADPRSFYIGTKIDGADLRGQNLREMLLPNLDLAKVRLDAETLLDDDALDGRQDSADADALVLVVSPRLWRTIEQSDLTPLRVKFYGIEDADLFEKACAVANKTTAKLVLADDSRGGWPWAHLAVPEDAIVLVHNGRMRPSRTQVLDFSLSERATVLVPILREDRPVAYAGPARLPSGLRDAILYFAADWKVLNAFVQRSHYCVFLRARGTATSPMTWLQLYSWAVQAGVERAGGLRLGGTADRLVMPGAEYEDLFFGHLHRQDIELPKGAKFIVAALVSPSVKASKSEGMSYLKSVWRLLTELGWRVANASRPSLTLPALRVTGPTAKLEMSILDHGEPTKRQVFSPERLKAVDLKRVQTIVVTEAADSATVVAQLVNARELWVSIRDLANFEARRAATIWTLIAHQAARLSRAGVLVQRTQYLAILMFAGLDATEAFEGREILRELLEDPEFLAAGRLRVTSFDTGEDVMEMYVQVSRSGREALGDVMTFRLIITPDGPLLQ